MSGYRDTVDVPEAQKDHGDSVSEPPNEIVASVHGWGGPLEGLENVALALLDPAAVLYSRVQDVMGVPQNQLRLVFQGQLMDKDEPLARYALTDGAVVLLTIVDCPANAFAPFEFNPQRLGKALAINASSPLTLKGNGNNWMCALGSLGIEVQESSGRKGYFEVRCVRGASGGGGSGMFIGLATLETKLETFLGGGEGAWGWRSHQYYDTLHGVIPFLPRLEYTDGDLVGVEVNCESAPELRLFVNGREVFQGALGATAAGKVLYPAVSLIYSYTEISVAANPPPPPRTSLP